MKHTDDYYARLGVKYDSTLQEITKSFRALAIRHHPDKDHGEGATETIQLINQAYEVLKDEEQRASYDRLYYSRLPALAKNDDPSSGAANTRTPPPWSSPEDEWTPFPKKGRSRPPREPSPDDEWDHEQKSRYDVEMQKTIAEEKSTFMKAERDFKAYCDLHSKNPVFRGDDMKAKIASWKNSREYLEALEERFKCWAERMEAHFRNIFPEFQSLPGDWDELWDKLLKEYRREHEHSTEEYNEESKLIIEVYRKDFQTRMEAEGVVDGQEKREAEKEMEKECLEAVHKRWKEMDDIRSGALKMDGELRQIWLTRRQRF